MDYLVKTYSYMHDGKVVFNYINSDEIPEQYKDEFLKWLDFQTRPIIEGIPNAAYSWDWERWLEHKVNKTNLIFD